MPKSIRKWEEIGKRIRRRDKWVVVLGIVIMALTSMNFYIWCWAAYKLSFVL
jgi:hypothetical protein